MMFFLDNEMDVDQDARRKVRGKVLLYTDWNAVEPMMAVHQDVSTALPIILQGLSGRYSPIESWYSSLLPVCLIHYLFSELNSHVYVRQEHMWAGKGRFTNALRDKDPVNWDTNFKGEMSLSVLMVMFWLFY